MATKREGIAVDRRLDAVRHARPLMETLPGWVPAAERERTASYLLYERTIGAT